MRWLLIGVGAAVAVWVLLLVSLMLAGRRSAARELAGLLPNMLHLFKGLMSDARVARRSKLLLGFAAAWVASPIDLIPEFLPVIGPLDDVVVAALVLRHVVRRAGPDVVAEHWRGGAGSLNLLLRAARAKPTQTHSAQSQAVSSDS